MNGGTKPSLSSDRIRMLYIVREFSGISLNKEQKQLLNDWIKELERSSKEEQSKDFPHMEESFGGRIFAN
jgi:hypothetical protein